MLLVGQLHSKLIQNLKITLYSRKLLYEETTKKIKQYTTKNVSVKSEIKMFTTYTYKYSQILLVWRLSALQNRYSNTEYNKIRQALFPAPLTHSTF